MKPILIVKTGSTDPAIRMRFGDFEDWFIARMDRSRGKIETVSPFAGEALPPVSALGGVMITGSHDMVTDRHPWSEKTARWIRGAVESEIPLLGVCYGHQLLAHAMGGVVGDNPAGRAVGTILVHLRQETSDRLFHGTPHQILAQACHNQSVLQLPRGATLLASSDLHQNYAFSVGSCAWGVQFHPEFNAAVLRDYIRLLADDLTAQGQDVDLLLTQVKETPHSEALLGRFQRLCTHGV